MTALDGNVVDQNGVPVEGALVYIYDQDGDLAELTDTLGQPADNPQVSGQNGYWQANVAEEGFYTARYYWGGRLRRIDANIIAGRDPIKRAEDAADYAEAFAGPTFPDTAAGLAGTTDGQSFAVNEDGIVTIYLNDGGSAVPQRVIATTAALASTDPGKGAAMVGFKGRTIEDRLSETVSVKDAPFSAVGDGVTDDFPAIQAALDYDPGEGVRRTIIIPHGTYLLSQSIRPKSNTDIICYGTLKAMDGAGGLVGWRHVHDCTWTGGVIDGANAVTTMGLNGMFVSAPDADTIGRSYNIHISNVTILRCRRDASTGIIGYGGGKGFTVQFGSNGVTWSNIHIEDCDIPFSIEGRLGADGAVYGVMLNDITARDCVYGPKFVSSPSQPSTGSVVGRGIHLRNCGTDEYVDGGVIMCDDAAGFDIEATIDNPTGRITVLRGNSQYCRFRLFVVAADIQDFYDDTPVLGQTATNATRGLNLDITARFSGTHYGYVCNQGDSNPLSWHVKLTHFGTLSSTWFKQVANFVSTYYTFDFYEMTTARAAYGEVTELWNSYGTGARKNFLSSAWSFLQALIVSKDSQNVSLRPDPTRNLILRDNANNAQARVWPDYFIVENTLRFGTGGDGMLTIVRAGTGSPEGVVSANVGSLYLRKDGGAGSVLYVKEGGGAGTTGWVAK